jgi:bifunctional DNA primase/polymerase-like protein
MSLHELALAAAELTKPGQGVGGLGLAVYPVAGDKAPCTKHGSLEAVDRALAAYRLFLKHHSACFIGVPTGVRTLIVAITVEAPAMRWFRHSFMRFPETRVHRVPDGGVNLLYKMPPPPIPILQCSYGKLARGVDVLGEGGSIVWPAPVNPRGSSSSCRQSSHARA